MKEDKMDRASSTNEVRREIRIAYSSGSQKEKDNLEDQDVVEWIIFKMDLRVTWSSMEGIGLPQDRGRPRALGFHKTMSRSSVAAQLTVSREGLVSMELVTVSCSRI
jgi:hypothetical protein